MRVVFCVYDFQQKNLPLQPWLTFLNIGLELVINGHQVHIITDTPDNAKPKGFTVHWVSSLRGTNKAQLIALIQSISPDAAVFIPTPLNLPALSWLRDIPGIRKVAFASYPFYQAGELLRACKRLSIREVGPYIRNLLVPSYLWRRFFLHSFQAIITQSETTRARLSTITGPPVDVHAIPPGIDLSKWQFRSKIPALPPAKMLYLGAATKIRGLEVALDSLSKMNKKNVFLRVLARRAGEEELRRIYSMAAQRNLGEQVTVRGGWMSHGDLIAEIHEATVVVQPFVLVPSELPVSVMEAIACGVPVIGTRIDGLPSTIARAGTVAEQADPSSLARIVIKLCDNQEILEEWHNACRKQRNQMMSWKQSAAEWEKVLFHEA